MPKGPSLDPAEKRLAVHVEDHPLEYVDFEDVIPPGNYGAGPMIVWDRGNWVALEDPEAGMAEGKLLFELRGHKLRSPDGEDLIAESNQKPFLYLRCFALDQ